MSDFKIGILCINGQNYVHLVDHQKYFDYISAKLRESINNGCGAITIVLADLKQIHMSSAW